MIKRYMCTCYMPVDVFFEANLVSFCIHRFTHVEFILSSREVNSSVVTSLRNPQSFLVFEFHNRLTLCLNLAYSRSMC